MIHENYQYGLSAWNSDVTIRNSEIIGSGSNGVVIEDKTKVKSYRFTVNFLGFILIALASTVLLMDSQFTPENLTIILATSLLLIGLRRLIEGILDHRVFKQPKNT